jgi:RNA polymerase sigma factor (sigma-70 family)
MTAKRRTTLLPVLRKMAGGHAHEQATDHDLLRRFVERRDEEAFATLLHRHGQMVLGIGLRLLHRRQDAEDVCQATFLVLARKAGTVRWRDSVANWLYGVAYRLALNARNAARRRNTREREAPPKPPSDPLAEITLRDLQAALDEELARLPAKYRAPLILCCLEGKSRDEAAQCLGVSLAGVKSRLEEGRELLRRRLARRGLALSLALGSFTLLAETGRAALPAALAEATGRAALAALAGPVRTPVVSANVVTLVEGGIRTMFVEKLKAAGTALAVLVGVLALGAVGLPWQSAQAQSRGPAVAAPLPGRLVAAPQEQRKVGVATPKEMAGKFLGDLEEVDVKANRITVREQKVMGINKKGEVVESTGKRTLLEYLYVGKAKIFVDGAEAKLADLKRGMRVQLHLEVRGHFILTKIEAYSAN